MARPRFRDLPIRRKLLLFIALVSSLAVLAAISAVVIYERALFRSRATEEMNARAELIGAATQGSLDLGDDKAALEILSKLSSSPDILGAAVYDKKGKVFASYTRPGMNRIAWPSPQRDGHEITDGELRLFRRIYSKGESIGTVYLLFSLRRISARLVHNEIICSLVIVAVVAISFFVSTVLERKIAWPIIRLAEAAKAISARGGYGVRVTKETNDEIGQLTDAFNHMLVMIAAREEALNHANRELGEELAERKQAQAALLASEEELKKLNAELEVRVAERTAKLRDTIGELQHISYSLTHDMRAPLRAMHSFAELLLTDCGPAVGEMGQAYLQRILAASTRLDNLIQDAFDYTQVAGAPIKLKSVNLDVLLRGMLESYPHFHPPNVEIRVEGELPQVLGNEALLTQCLSNLLHNAIKFVKPGEKPQIKVWADLGSASPAASAERTVRIWIEDEGIGIPKEAQERIFGMFQRVHADYEGTGIGLAIVRKAVERMGGRVGVESEVGRGSRFWVELRSGDALPPQDAGELDQLKAIH